MNHLSTGWRRLLGFAAVSCLASVAAACGGSSSSDPGKSGASAVPGSSGAKAAAPVEIKWWHIANTDPGKADFQAIADKYMTAHPNVKIKITVLENEAFKTAIQTNLQAGDIPDLFQSWGGGKMRQQVSAGLLKDITAETSAWKGEISSAASALYAVDGKQYGMPYNAGMVGFWYNKAQFAKAGITTLPTTWDDLLATVKKLKGAGLTPVAVGAGDKWPAHFWYSYLMVRLCGAQTMKDLEADGNFSRPCVVEAGKKVLDLVALAPFQKGYLGAPWDGPDGEDGVMAVQGAAMDLMGQWAPGAFKAQAGITDPAKPLPWDVGWFPFPAVPGGTGDAGDAFGGTDGFVVGKNAPPEAVDFLHAILGTDGQKTFADHGLGLPTNTAAQVAVKDPNMKAVLDGLGKAKFVQLYLDQDLTAEIAGQVGDQTALLFANKTTAENAAAEITKTAKK